jgi:hypothetical protein
VILASGSGSPSGQLSSTALGEVPTNHVTGSGTATIRLNKNQAVVTVTTSGLDYNEDLVHLMHIHAGGKGLCPPASAARLHNGHLTISTTDGINYYGPAVVALTVRGDTSPSSILAFPRYLSGGNIHYTRTITLSPTVIEELRRGNAVVVVHGTDYDHSGIYSGVLDPSELDKSVPGTATAPALCGRPRRRPIRTHEQAQSFIRPRFSRMPRLTCLKRSCAAPAKQPRPCRRSGAKGGPVARRRSDPLGEIQSALQRRPRWRIYCAPAPPGVA